jgi:hypothetical protein
MTVTPFLARTGVVTVVPAPTGDPPRLKESTRAVRAGMEVEPAELNGESDHVHLRMHFPPKVAVPKLVNSREGGLVPADALGAPRTGAPLLAGQTVVVGALT